MSVSVCCPGCQVACEVPAELLGRTGRCNECGRRIRLATPTAELLDSLQEELAPLDDLGELEPIGDLAPLDAGEAPPIAPPVPAPERVPLQPTAERAPRPNRTRAGAAPPRGPSKAMLAVLALVGLIGGGAGGAFLVKRLVPPEQRATEQRAAVDPPAPAPAPQPESKPQPKPPEPKRPEPKPPEAKAQPGPMLAGPKSTLKLSAPVLTLTAGGGGRFVVFQTAVGELAVYDAQLGRVFWTLKGGQPDDLVAVSRAKLFLGRGKDAKIVRFDLATGVSEGQATWERAAAPIRHLAIGSASDGPLVVVARLNEGAYRVRLHDPETFAELAYPIDDPSAPAARGFPFTEPSAARWVAAGADGRVLMLGNRYFARTEDRYRSAVLPGTGSSPHLPTTDGLAFVGTKQFSFDGAPLPPADLPPGTMRRYIPAASGPFVVSVEYTRADPSVVKLWLHLGTDPKPLGPLPGAEEISAWAKDDPGWVAKLHHRLIFAPDPGQLIICPPGAAAAQVYPIDLPGMLRAAGRDIVFTSTPPAEAHPARAYSYRATAATAVGPVTFALQAGPAGMTVTRDGLLTWVRPSGNRLSHEVALVATAADGKRTVQSFRVHLPRKNPDAPP